jgi:hypothetical protein
MKFTSSGPVKPIIQFKDVPIARFYVDDGNDLMFKYSNNGAVRIACSDGYINEAAVRDYEPSPWFGVKEILPYDRVEF